MTARFMVKSNTKRMPMIFKLTERLKRMLLTPESLTHQHLCNLILQQSMPRMTKDFHILMEVELIIQVPLQWIQMPQFGKEELSMTARFMVKSNTRRMPMIFKLMVRSKRMLPILESHMHQLLSRLVKVLLESQEQFSFLTLVSHI